jgi:hypothetical protein
MKQRKFVVEGEVNIGPRRHPIFVDTNVLGSMLIDHFHPPEIANFFRLGHARITVELLEDEEE